MSNQTNWFRIPKRVNDPQLRLICFPYAGGNAGTYVNWVKNIPSTVELIAIEPPGRAVRMLEQPFDDMNTLIGDLLPHYQHLIDRPYIVFGHSLGGRMAYDISLKCQLLGLRLPSHFIASASRAPHIVKQRKNIYDLPDPQFLDKLRGFNGTSEDILSNKELMDLLMPMLRADFKIADMYLTDPKPLDVPFSVWGGQEDHEISKLDLESWADCCAREVEMEYLPGGHLFVDSHAAGVLERLNKILQRASTAVSQNVRQSDPILGYS